MKTANQKPIPSLTATTSLNEQGETIVTYTSQYLGTWEVVYIEGLPYATDEQIERREARMKGMQ